MPNTPVSQWLRLFKLAGAAAGLFVAWVLAPILGFVGVGVWRFIGVLGAATVGFIGRRFVGSSTRTVGALVVGFGAGAVLAELVTPTDVSRSFVSLMEAVAFMRLELGSMIAAGAVGSSAAGWLASAAGRSERHMP